MSSWWQVPALHWLDPSSPGPGSPPVITFRCPTCKTAFEVADAYAGRKTSCAKCGQRLKGPAPAPPPNPRKKTVLGELHLEPDHTPVPAKRVPPRAREETPTRVVHVYVHRGTGL